MARKLSTIEREIRDHPDKFDFGDIPPDRVKIPAQEKAYDDLAPLWAKSLAARKLRPTGSNPCSASQLLAGGNSGSISE